MYFRAVVGGILHLRQGTSRCSLTLASVWGACWLNQQKVCFIFSNGPVLNTFGHNIHFTSIQFDGAITHFHLEFAFNNQKEIVCVCMAVPNKFAFDFDDHEVMPVEHAYSSWTPVFCERVELG